MTDDSQFNSYDDAIKAVEDKNLYYGLYSKCLDLLKNEEGKKTLKNFIFDNTYSPVSIDDIILAIQTVLPEARLGINYFPEAIVKKQKDYDELINAYGFVRVAQDKNSFIDWTVGHRYIENALMLAFLKTLRDLEKQNAV